MFASCVTSVERMYTQVGEALLRIHAQMEKKLIEALIGEKYNRKLRKTLFGSE